MKAVDGCSFHQLVELIELAVEQDYAVDHIGQREHNSGVDVDPGPADRFRGGFPGFLPLLLFEQLR